jgi:hypothetical protein
MTRRMEREEEKEEQEKEEMERASSITMDFAERRNQIWGRTKDRTGSCFQAGKRASTRQYLSNYCYSWIREVVMYWTCSHLLYGVRLIKCSLLARGRVW